MKKVLLTSSLNHVIYDFLENKLLFLDTLYLSNISMVFSTANFILSAHA